MRQLVRLFWIAGGLISFAMGFVGIFVPLLPTTVFMLIAAFCFARGSNRLNDWLVNHPRFGPPIRLWRKYGAITMPAKRLAVLTMALSVVITTLAGVPLYAVIAQTLVLCPVAWYVVTRPSPPDLRRS
jgi:uncharacterized membrane protein YbaN (DUF454 family)